METQGTRIKRFREKNGLTMEEVGKSIGLTKQAIYKYENDIVTNIPYDKIIIAAYDKLNYCLENEIEIFIDDSLEVLESLSSHKIKCYLMTTPMNQSIIVSKDIKRVSNWEEIYNDLKEN